MTTAKEKPENKPEQAGSTEVKEIPYIVHEGVMSRFERIIRRLWVLVILLIALLVGSNLAWLIYESQYEVTQTTQIKQDTAGGDNNHMVGIDYGETDSNSGKDQSTQER